MINADLREILENKLGISISSVLLPDKNIDIRKWAVVACDQYTAEPEYWKRVNDFVGDEPSTLRLIFPEAFLKSESEEEKSSRMLEIGENMDTYLRNGLFEELKDTVILTERTFQNGNTRHGLIFAVDLERYDYNKGSQSLIRATEGTVADRLPPRIRIRERAGLELPHIMLLIDDREKTVIEPLAEKTDTLPRAYSSELMMQGGRIRGWKVSDENDIYNMARALLKLADTDLFRTRYHVGGKYGVLLFAVGDGNHSLAAAKACWENLKKTLGPNASAGHPARYALVEVVNVHDKGLVFEPIHRVLFNVGRERLISAFYDYYTQKGCKVHVLPDSESPCEGPRIGTDDGPCGGSDENSDIPEHIIKFSTSEGSGRLVVEHPIVHLDVATLQNFLDHYLELNPRTGIDYVHGGDVAERLAVKPGNMGFFLSPMDKDELFRTVILDGALPRKTFSMGEASEKRFYLEARRIR